MILKDENVGLFLLIVGVILFVTILIILIFILRFEFKKKWKQAIVSFKSHKYDNSNQILDDLLNTYPRFANGWILKGNIALARSENSNAFKFYSNALKLKPNSSKALCGMGVVMRERNRFDLAEDYYYKALKNDPTNYYAKSSLMILELIKGNYDVAITLGEDSIIDGFDNVEPSILGNLLLGYHYSGREKKRNSLIDYLRNVEYVNLIYILLAIDNNLSIEELIDRHHDFLSENNLM